MQLQTVLCYSYTGHVPVLKTNETIQLHIEVIQSFKAHWYYMQQLLYYLKLCMLSTQCCMFNMRD